MTSRRFLSSRFVLPIVMIFCFLLILVACTQDVEETPDPTALVEDPPTEEPTSEVEITVEPLSFPLYPCPELDGFVLNSGLTQNGYVKNQLIITGHPDAIDLIRPELTEAIAVEFGVTNDVIGNLIAAVPLFDPQSPQDEIGIIGLYEISDALAKEWEDNGVTHELVWVVVDKFNELAQIPDIVSDDLRFDIYPLAEPNYVVVEPGGVSGDPGSSGIEGDPGSSGIEGDPVDISSIAGTPEGAAQLFTGQWAFTNINLLDSDGNRLVSEPGEDVKIIIFDSAPFATGTHEISWAANPFELCVSALIADAREDDPAINTTAASSHGLFVAGLANSVAPASQIHLIQVLDDNLNGSLFTLLNALHVYLDGELKLAMEAAGEIPAKTVINLSLGFEIDPFVDELSDEAMTALENLGEYIRQSTGPLEGGAVPGIPAVSLPTVLTRYSNLGNVIVAASGNDSGPIQAPAAYQYVIGVAANNIDNGHACFSNQGNIAAPGGDSNLLGSEEGRAACAVDLEAECAGNADCAKAVISLIHPDHITSGYAYWYGTSFSTPIVSGLAALVLAEDIDFDPTLPQAIPGRVQGQIYGRNCDSITTGSEPGASNPMGAGVIEVGAILSACP